MTNKLTLNGHISLQLELPEIWKELCICEDYQALDKLAENSLKRDGFLFNEIKKMSSTYFHGERKFEHILALREGPQDDELDGIWHDDGTRLLAFSMSLNLNYKQINGGELLMRSKSDRNNVISIAPRPFATLTVFCTGVDGWEHKTSLVNLGKRLVLAGWLS